MPFQIESCSAHVEMLPDDAKGSIAQFHSHFNKFKHNKFMFHIIYGLHCEVRQGICLLSGSVMSVQDRRPQREEHLGRTEHDSKELLLQLEISYFCNTKGGMLCQFPTSIGMTL